MNLTQAKKLIADRIKVAKEYGGLVHLSIEDSEKIIGLLASEPEQEKPNPVCPSDDDIFDALVTALEGGSNYWYYLPIHKDQLRNMASREASKNGNRLGRHLTPSEMICFLLSKDTKFLIVDNENRDEELGWLSLENLRKGAAQYVEYREPFDPAMDADEADCFFQYAIMGELVYG